MLKGMVNLLSLKAIKEENSSLSPGAYLIKFGLVTFATTVGGNCICMDLNKINNREPRIVYADHTWFSFDEENRRVEFSLYPKEIPENDQILSLDVIKKYLPEICETFSGFLVKVANEEFEDIEEYYEKIMI